MTQPSDRSAEYRRIVDRAEVGADAPVETPEKPGEHLSGGEVNNVPALTKSK